VAAAYSKRRRDDVQPIRPDLAEAIRLWMANKTPRLPVFGNLSSHTNLMTQADLKAAGVPYRDGSDRVADFHALRHSSITALAMSIAPVKVIQSLARHSTPMLTLGVYAHVGLYDQTAALDALPAMTATGPGSEGGKLAATETDGPINELLSLSLRRGRKRAEFVGWWRDGRRADRISRGHPRPIRNREFATI